VYILLCKPLCTAKLCQKTRVVLRAFCVYVRGLDEPCLEKKPVARQRYRCSLLLFD